MKVLLSDIGGVIAHDLYNELLIRLLLRDNPQFAPTDKETFSQIMKCGSQSWALYKIGGCTEATFFLNIVQQSSITSELKRRGFLSDEQAKDEEQIVQLLIKELRERHLKLFDAVVDMMLKWKNDHSERVLFAVLSNHTIEWLPELFRIHAPRLDLLFDRKDLIFNSAMIQSAKPDRAVFIVAKQSIERILQQEHVPILFVDNKLDNVKAAIEVGLSAVHFDASKEEPSALLHHLNQFLDGHSVTHE